jgi:hypothetical protein
MCAIGTYVQCSPSVSQITGQMLTLFFLSEIAAANETVIMKEILPILNSFFPHTHTCKIVLSHVINISESLFNYNSGLYSFRN